MANKIPAGRWRLRPYDPKCKTFVDADRTVEDQIRCRVPAWTGNFDELVAQLVPHRVTLDQLPLLTVHQIGLFLIDTVQGGSLRAGPTGTAAHTIVEVPPLTPAVDDNEHARIARRLESDSRRVLWFMRKKNARSAIDKLTRQFIADELGLTIDDVQACGEELAAAGIALGKKLLESKDGRGGGWWLSPDGDRVAEYCAPPALRVTDSPRLRANRG